MQHDRTTGPILSLWVTAAGLGHDDRPHTGRDLTLDQYKSFLSHVSLVAGPRQSEHLAYR